MNADIVRIGSRAMVVTVGMLAGCDRVFSLALPPDAEVVVERHHVSIALTTRHVFNAGGGVPLAANAEPVTSAQIPNAFARQGDVELSLARSDGTFELDPIVGEPYRVVLEYANREPTEIQSTLPRLRFTDNVYGRPQAGPTIDTVLYGDLSDRNTSDEAIVVTTGIWSETRDTELVNGRYEVAWNRAAIDTAQNDRVIILQDGVVNEGLPGAYRIVGRRAIIADFQMAMAPMNRLDARLGALDRRDCVRIVAQRALASSALAAAYPQFEVDPGGVRDFWALYAVPTPLLGIEAATLLGLSFDATEDQIVAFSSPTLPGHTPIAAMGASRRRDVMVVGHARRYTVRTRQHQSVVTSTDCASPPTSELVAGAVEIPHAITLAGVSIDDGIPEVPLGTELVELAWAGSGAQLYRAVLVELPPDGSPGVKRRLILSTRPNVVIDRALLEPGRHYHFELDGIRGFAAGDGDFTMVQYPYDIANGVSSPFTVTW